MAKVVKWGTDADLIDQQENEEREGFEPYDGPMPPNRTILRCAVKRVTVDTFKSGNRGVVVLLEVDDPAKPKYKGLAYWERIVDSEENSWKIRQFMDALGSKTPGADWNKTKVEERDGNTVVVAFGKIRLEGAFIRISHKIGSYQGEPKAEVGRFLIHDAAKLEATKAKSRKASDDDDEDDEDDSEPPF